MWTASGCLSGLLITANCDWNKSTKHEKSDSGNETKCRWPILRNTSQNQDDVTESRQSRQTKRSAEKNCKTETRKQSDAGWNSKYQKTDHPRRKRLQSVESILKIAKEPRQHFDVVVEGVLFEPLGVTHRRMMTLHQVLFYWNELTSSDLQKFIQNGLSDIKWQGKHNVYYWKNITRL